VSNALKKIVRAKISGLAKGLGCDASKLGDDEEIPASGLLDSAAIMELILWLETHFALEIDQEAITLQNFGTINAVTNYLTVQAGASDNES
jgi:acyl carrier protein